MEEGRNLLIILTVKPTGKRYLGRPWCRWKDNVRIDFKEVGVNMRNYIDLGHNIDYWEVNVNLALNLWVP